VLSYLASYSPVWDLIRGLYLWCRLIPPRAGKYVGKMSAVWSAIFIAGADTEIGGGPGKGAVPVPSGSVVRSGNLTLLAASDQTPSSEWQTSPWPPQSFSSTRKHSPLARSSPLHKCILSRLESRRVWQTKFPQPRNLGVGDCREGQIPHPAWSLACARSSRGPLVQEGQNRLAKRTLHPPTILGPASGRQQRGYRRCTA
jgi:hypothetical protein